MRKVATLAAAVAVSLGVLTACSGGGDYCGELKGYAETAKGLDMKDTDAIAKMVTEAEKVSKSAPDDLKDDWKTLLDFSKKAQEAKGDQAKLAEIAKDSGKMTTAMEAIQKHAKDTCKIDLEA